MGEWGRGEWVDLEQDGNPWPFQTERKEVRMGVLSRVLGRGEICGDS